MKKLLTLLVLCKVVALFHALPESVHTFHHPDKNGYQSVVAGSEKHKYGYELKENKHFHHTTTEKDGVRLGCYGFELEGKMYSTQYVADSHGYRIVSNQDIITVYPKFGEKRTASFRREFHEDPSLTENIRYFFPAGCKGVDVQIDNSSRLRSITMPNPQLYPRLPVTMRPVPNDEPQSITSANTYIPPGPPHIYAPNQIPAFIKPPNEYLPPINAYLPPTKSTTTPASNIYLPPVNNTFVLPDEASNVYLPPVSTDSTPTISHEILPPVLPEEICENFSPCCDDPRTGKLVIPIPLKKSNGRYGRDAQLVLPIKGLDNEIVRILTASLSDGIDATQLIKTVLHNFL